MKILIVLLLTIISLWAKPVPLCTQNIHKLITLSEQIYRFNDELEYTKQQKSIYKYNLLFMQTVTSCEGRTELQLQLQSFNNIFTEKGYLNNVD